MRISQILVTFCLCSVLSTTVSSHQKSIPEDYPTHELTSDCVDQDGLSRLQQKLHEYNVTRVEVGTVLHSMADSYRLEGELREELLGFAEFFETLATDMPQPDPDSDKFRNFDFKIGLTLTALTVFLNTRDESLTRRFKADQQNPDSELGLYLAKLDKSRDAYLEKLENVNDMEKTGTCS